MSLILGIESSCDETACAIVEDGCTVKSTIIASQIKVHAQFGGVVPELAAREHLKALDFVTSKALDDANVTMDDIDGIAFTQGPGLIPALLVGLNYAKGLARGHKKPLIGVNHFMAHIYGAFLDGKDQLLANPENYPLLALVVSGGHTSLVLVEADGSARQLGSTLDDAAGEALDKGAKLLDLGYPGGPIIQKVAENGDSSKFDFPRPLTGGSGKALSPEHKYNFSFSGIKTALLYHMKKNEGNNDPQFLADTVASYQMAVVDTLVRKAIVAVKDTKAKTCVLAGGVACNALLRKELTERMPKFCQLHIAKPIYCTDNAAMVAGLGYHSFKRNEFVDDTCDSFARLPKIVRAPFI